MRKIAKRTPPVVARTNRDQLRSRPTVRDGAASGTAARAAIASAVDASEARMGVGVLEGHVVAAGEPGTVRAVLAGGEAVEALCPAHVDAAWLREACARAPVAAVFVVARPSGRHILWGIFPGVAHADVKCDIVIQGREVKVDAESLQLSSRNAHLRLDAEGNVTLKGRDVTSHARRVNRIKGGSIRLN
jgi:hypothetical protein